jgi:hypothetical protein
MQRYKQFLNEQKKNNKIKKTLKMPANNKQFRRKVGESDNPYDSKAVNRLLQSK